MTDPLPAYETWPEHGLLFASNQDLLDRLRQSENRQDAWRIQRLAAALMTVFADHPDLQAIAWNRTSNDDETYRGSFSLEDPSPRSPGGPALVKALERLDEALDVLIARGTTDFLKALSDRLEAADNVWEAQDVEATLAQVYHQTFHEVEGVAPWSVVRSAWEQHRLDQATPPDGPVARRPSSRL